jgi:hypothetical protein
MDDDGHGQVRQAPRAAAAYTHLDAAGRPHYLHGRWVVQPGGSRQLVVYFAGSIRSHVQLAVLPAGYEVVVSRANGRPYARRRNVRAVGR